MDKQIFVLRIFCLGVGYLLLVNLKVWQVSITVDNLGLPFAVYHSITAWISMGFYRVIVSVCPPYL